MNIERHLHHAARELREVPIEVPALDALSHSGRRTTRRPKLAALAAPMLFVTGSLLAVGVMQRQAVEPVHSDITAAPAAENGVPAPLGAGLVGVTTPSVHEELQMIARLLDDPLEATTSDPASDAATDVVEFTASGPS